MRPPQLVLGEHLGLLTVRSTDALYEEQPDLWALGESGRQHTFEDFGHHFRALAALDVDLFASHVRYCIDLFARRDFPLRWLEDAWRIMGQTLTAELPEAVATPAVATLIAGVRATNS